MTIKTVVRKALRFIMPYGIIDLRRRQLRKEGIRKENEIVNYFKGLDTKASSEEMIEIAEYFEKYAFSIMPYEFQW
jgi:hypothetical protein